MPEIVQLLVSPIHRYVGRPAHGPLPAPPGELVESIEVRARLGVVGDRYFGKRAHRHASVTIMAQESLPVGADLVQARRNILTRGLAIDELIGSVISLDSGLGPVRFEVRRRANPCAWMDTTIGPGAFRALRGKGGARCVPLTDGVLRLGVVQIEIAAGAEV